MRENSQSMLALDDEQTSLMEVFIGKKRKEKKVTQKFSFLKNY
jgi:hypothetical protein